jgi:hypothetical protein
LEQILLTAMARNRDERYENAGLIAQDLRSLNLRSTRSVATRNAKLSTNAYQRSYYEGIVVRPPKRPQIQPPRYLDLEATQPPPGETGEHFPGEPALKKYTQQGKTIDIDNEDEVPTKPLSPIIDLDTLTQQKVQQTKSPTNTHSESKRTLWKQLQRIFKSNET